MGNADEAPAPEAEDATRQPAVAGNTLKVNAVKRIVMSRAESDIVIPESPEAVWSILSHMDQVPEVFPDVFSTKADPEGPVFTGQKIRMFGRVAGMVMELSAEVDQVEPCRKLVIRALPAGPIKEYRNTLTLEPTGNGGTRVSSVAEYEFAQGFLGELFSRVMVGKVARKNVSESLKRLKELAGLKEMRGHPANE